MSATTMSAYRFALDPTPTQQRALLSHAGAARVAHNWALARVKATMSQRSAERSYGIADHDLTPTGSWSLYSLRRAFAGCPSDPASRSRRPDVRGSAGKAGGHHRGDSAGPASPTWCATSRPLWPRTTRSPCWSW